MPNTQIAELWSYDKKSVFRITFYGYENPRDKWLVTDIEYESGRVFYRERKWEFDSQSLQWAVNYLKKFKGECQVKQTILTPPYGADELAIVYHSGRRKKRLPVYLPHEGHFLCGEITNFKFRFKTNRMSLRKFELSLQRALRTFSPHPG